MNEDQRLLRVLNAFKEGAEIPGSLYADALRSRNLKLIDQLKPIWAGADGRRRIIAASAVLTQQGANYLAQHEGELPTEQVSITRSL